MIKCEIIRLTTRLVMALSIALCMGCHAGSNEGKMTAPRAAENEMPFFVMSPLQERDFLEKVSSIKVGASRMSVTNLLGSATSDKVISSKAGVFKARVLIYYSRIWKRNVANEKMDTYVRFEFNRDDVLLRVTSNIAFVGGKP